MTRAALLITLVLTFTCPAVALAQGGTVPASNPVANQYAEMLPTASGNKPSSGPGASTAPGSPAPAHKTSVPARVVKRLDASGAAGKATVALAVATAQPVTKTPPSQKAAGPGRPAATTSNRVSGETGAASPATAQVIKALTGSTGGSGGLGVLLPVILVISLVAASAAGLLRLRGQS